MTDEKQIVVSRVVRASADQVFAVLSDPQQHQAIDGSGLLQGTTSGPVSGIGHVFAMEMYRDDLGPWRSFNTVTEFEPNAAIGWAPNLDPDCPLAPKLAGITTGGHHYIYRLRETSDGTEVQHIYDWSGVTDPNFEALCPYVSREQLMGTLDRLAEAVEQPETTNV
jgi:hypothetical protein